MADEKLPPTWSLSGAFSRAVKNVAGTYSRLGLYALVGALVLGGLVTYLDRTACARKAAGCADAIGNLRNEALTDHNVSPEEAEKTVEIFRSLLDTSIGEMSRCKCKKEWVDQLKALRPILEEKRPPNEESQASIDRFALGLGQMVTNMYVVLGEDYAKGSLADGRSSQEVLGLTEKFMETLHVKVTEMQNVQPSVGVDLGRLAWEGCQASREAGAYFHWSWESLSETEEGRARSARFVSDLGELARITNDWIPLSQNPPRSIALPLSKPYPLDEYATNVQRRLFAAKALMRKSFTELRSEQQKISAQIHKAK